MFLVVADLIDMRDPNRILYEVFFWRERESWWRFTFHWLYPRPSHVFDSRYQAEEFISLYYTTSPESFIMGYGCHPSERIVNLRIETVVIPSEN